MLFRKKSNYCFKKSGTSLSEMPLLCILIIPFSLTIKSNY